MTESLMPSGRAVGYEGMTCGARDWIKRPETVTSDERSTCLIIKNSETKRVKVDRAIILSGKFANKAKPKGADQSCWAARKPVGWCWQQTGLVGV
ncbi:hypothetical protein L6452_08600 [Arctium lappa]|uniref:Uncharacterized protein n=1 Tax=Arctium lappa TaxID=4217 RepID=A0ACB9DI12_ARCLA|nr:hypothetical protein L6452_08600 [Arctium lappa]